MEMDYNIVKPWNIPYVTEYLTDYINGYDLF